MRKYLILFVLLVLATALYTMAKADVGSREDPVNSTSGKITPAAPLHSSSGEIESAERENVVEERAEGAFTITPHSAGTVVREPRTADVPLVDQMCIDDGTMVNAHAHWLANDAWAVNYTPAMYPALVESIQIYILSQGDPFWPWPDGIHQPFVALIFDDGGGQPGAEIFRDTVQADDIPPSWVMAYPNVPITSGDFWVAAEQLDDNPNCEGMGVDASYDNGLQNWFRIGGVWTQNPGLTGDLMMCAFVSPLVDTSSVIHSGNTLFPPNIDGDIGLTEWADATVRDVSDVFGIYDAADTVGSATIYVMNDETCLYMAFDAAWDTSMSDYDDFSPYFDDNHDGLWPTAPDSNEGNLWFQSMSSGVDSVLWRYFQAGPSVGPNRTVPFPVGVGEATGHHQFECVVPFGAMPEELQALPGDTVGFFVLAYDQNASYIYSWWPYDNLVFNDPVDYGHLVLAPGFGPIIYLAEASDNMDSIPGIDPDDFVLLEFDEPTNKPAIDWSNIDNVFQLSGGHTWLDGFSNIGGAVWNGPGNQLIVTLSTTSGPPTVAVGDTITPDGVTVTDALGNPCVSPIVISGSFGGPTGVEELKTRAVPSGFFALSQNRPNPFHEKTEIQYAVPAKSEVSLRIYDLTGRLVRTLVETEVEAGMHVSHWDSRDETGSVVPGGVYLYRLTSGDQVSTRKLILLR